MPDEPEIEVARYQFNSWARKGISSRIGEPDTLGENVPSAAERAQVSIPVDLNGTGLSKDFELIGPGDIIGINRDMIVRTDPLNWITDTEPNYLAFIEFYDEDFAWRYTPSKPVFPAVDASAPYKPSKLRPWVFLLVLEEGEFEKTKRRTPLSSIKLKVGDVFPPVNETWLWAHVHSNANIPDSDLTEEEKFLASLNRTIDDDPDQLYCRLMSPRKLLPNKAYAAFLIPSFETGRLAGLEQKTEDIPSQEPSWGDNNEGLELPVYYEWTFRTGLNTDFESLVTALKPVAMDPKVGIRDMDCSDPGFVRANSTQKFPGTKPPVIGLEGALKSPFTVSTVFPDVDDAGEFPQQLKELLNLPIDIQGTSASGDPVISVPFYGNNHAKKSITDTVRFDSDKTSWIHDLNKDPRTRVAAGLGTLAIQKNQEKLMQKAWQQVTGVIKANKLITLTQFHLNIAIGFTNQTLVNLSPVTLLSVSRPVLSKVMGSPTTVLHQLKESRLPAAVFSGAFRRVARPRMLKRLSPDKSFDTPAMVKQLNEGKLSAAPALGVPGGIPNTQGFADIILANQPPSSLSWILNNRHLLFIALLVLFVILAFVTGSFLLFGALAVVAAGGYVYINKIAQQATDDRNAAASLTDPAKELEMIANIPQRPDFTLTLSDETTTPPPTLTAPNTDSVEAKSYRKAMTDLAKRLSVKAPEKVINALDLPNAYKKVSDAIHPHRSFAKRLTGLVAFPGNIVIKDQPEKIFPAMAYPDFDDPMYKKLTDISDELLLPNLKLIPQNCISLLKTNPKFIESYLIGLNHEMGRELLWREYPTDQRGSYFRQFWDVRGIVKPGDSGAGQDNKDIVPIDTWLTNSDLGKHNSRTVSGDSPEKLVLVIRGDLLKKYPGAVIFAQKATSRNADGLPEMEQAVSDADFTKKIKFPLFKAEILPDIRFFGFDLTIEQAKGTSPTTDFNDTLGWFFCIAEPPGEARFGMDINYTVGEDEISWDNLAWTNFGDEEIKFITKGKVPTVPGLNSVETARWATDAATMADILFQKPSMVAVHAEQMLANLTNG